MDSHLFACVSDINKIKREAAEKNSRSMREGEREGEEAEQIINKLQFMSCQQQEEQQTAKMELVREEEHGKQAKRNKTKRNDTKGRQQRKRMSKRRIVYVAQVKLRRVVQMRVVKLMWPLSCLICTDQGKLK